MNTFTIIRTGWLSANPYWGENGQRVRKTQAACTLIRTNHGNILVDPSMEAEELSASLFNCSGLHSSDIQMIYVTHRHEDHWMGLDAFSDAQWYMAPEDLQFLQNAAQVFSEKKQSWLDHFLPAPEELVPDVRTVALPGHTPGLRGLLFDAPEGRVLLAADSVMNVEYFAAREAYAFCVDYEQARASVTAAAQMADVIIPGHGNYFLTDAYPEKEMVGANSSDPVFDGPYQYSMTIREALADLKVRKMLFGAGPEPLPTQMEHHFALNADMPVGRMLQSRMGEEQLRGIFEQLNA